MSPGFGWDPDPGTRIRGTRTWGTRTRVVGVYDIELTDMEGDVHRFMMGRAIITREVTK